MAYELINWKDFPNEETPLSSFNLNHMDTQIKRNADDIEEHTGDIELISKDVKELNKNIVTTDRVSINGTASIDGAEGNIQSISFVGESRKSNNLIDRQEIRGTLSMYKLPMPLPAGTYTISFDSYEGSGAIRLSNTTDTSTDSVVSTNKQTQGNRSYITITTTFVSNYINSSGSEARNNTMLNSGSTPLPYEPFGIISPQGKVESISDDKYSSINASEIAPDKQLCGLGDNKNVLEVFADGTGRFTRRVGFDTFNQCDSFSTATWRFFFDHLSYEASRTGTVINNYGFSSRLWDSTSNKKIYFQVDSTYTQASVDAMLATTPIQIVYDLETPIVEELTSKEVAEFLSLKTFNNSTITTDGTVEIVYYKNNGNGQTIANLGARVNDNAYTKSMISDEWLSTKTYAQGEYCISNNSLWKSKVNNNLGNVPTEGSYWTTTSVSKELVRYKKVIGTTSQYGEITLDNTYQVVSLVVLADRMFATVRDGRYIRITNAQGNVVADTSITLVMGYVNYTL